MHRWVVLATVLTLVLSACVGAVSNSATSATPVLATVAPTASPTLALTATPFDLSKASVKEIVDRMKEAMAKVKSAQAESRQTGFSNESGRMVDITRVELLMEPDKYSVKETDAGVNKHSGMQIQIGNKVWLYDTLNGSTWESADGLAKPIKVNLEALGLHPATFDAVESMKRMGDASCGTNRGCVQIGETFGGSNPMVKEVQLTYQIDRTTFQLAGYIKTTTFADTTRTAWVVAYSMTRYGETFEIKPPQ